MIVDYDDHSWTQCVHCDEHWMPYLGIQKCKYCGNGLPNPDHDEGPFDIIDVRENLGTWVGGPRPEVTQPRVGHKTGRKIPPWEAATYNHLAFARKIWLETGRGVIVIYTASGGLRSLKRNFKASVLWHRRTEVVYQAALVRRAAREEEQSQFRSTVVPVGGGDGLYWWGGHYSEDRDYIE